jgi:hypothetical protein
MLAGYRSVLQCLSTVEIRMDRHRTPACHSQPILWLPVALSRLLVLVFSRCMGHRTSFGAIPAYGLSRIGKGHIFAQLSVIDCVVK